MTIDRFGFASRICFSQCKLTQGQSKHTVSCPGPDIEYLIEWSAAHRPGLWVWRGDPGSRAVTQPQRGQPRPSGVRPAQPNGTCPPLCCWHWLNKRPTFHYMPPSLYIAARLNTDICPNGLLLYSCVKRDRTGPAPCTAICGAKCRPAYCMLFDTMSATYLWKFCKTDTILQLIC